MEKTLPKFVYLVFLSGLCLNLGNLVADPDVMWHLQAGHHIIDNRMIPDNNIFSFTAANYHWFNISWAWDVMLAFFDKLSPLYLPAAISAVLISITLYILAREMVKSSDSLIATGITLLLGCLIFVPIATARPQLATMLFATLFMIILNRKSSRTLIALPALMILWANIHGGFIAGFVIIGAYGLEAIWHKDKVIFRNLLLVFAGCAVASLLNPYGIYIYEGIYRTLGGKLAKHVSEWQSANNPLLYIHPISLAFLIAINYRRHRISEIALCLIWVVAGLLSARNLPLLFIISAPAFAKSLAFIISQNSALNSKDNEYRSDLNNAKLSKVLSVLCLAFTVVVASGILKSTYYDSKSVLRKTPIDAIAYIKANHASARVLNSYNLGGYIIYFSEGSLKTFIDSRAETAFSEYLIGDYLTFHYMKSGWQDIPQKHNIDLLLLEAGSPQIAALLQNDTWKIEFEDNLTVILKSALPAAKIYAGK